jgi:hypothetical protein
MDNGQLKYPRFARGQKNAARDAAFLRRRRSGAFARVLWLFEQTTPSGFACHPSTGGEFIVLRDRSCLRFAHSQFSMPQPPRRRRSGAFARRYRRKIPKICGNLRNLRIKKAAYRVGTLLFLARFNCEL